MRTTSMGGVDHRVALAVARLHETVPSQRHGRRRIGGCVTDTPRIAATSPWSETMHSTKGTARRAGLLYLLILLLALINHISISGRFVVPGDSTATARNISAGALTYRLGILSGLASELMLLGLALSLYSMLKDVDRKHAKLMVTLVAVSVAFGLVNLLNQTAPLILSSGADYWSEFTRPQLDALAYAFLRLRSTGVYMAMALWGLWLFPFGVLVIKSGFFPRLLGILLIVGCFAYLAVSVTAMALPLHRPVVEQVLMPLCAIGEVSMILWLLVKGAKEPPSLAAEPA